MILCVSLIARSMGIEGERRLKDVRVGSCARAFRVVWWEVDRVSVSRRPGQVVNNVRGQNLRSVSRILYAIRST